MSDFNSKTVWLTGASSGFGEALAYEFANRGANIILSARRADKLSIIQKEIGEKARILPLDLTKFGEFKDKTEEALALFGSIDILIHNAGIAQRAPALETSLEVEKRIFDVDFFSYVELTRTLLPHFIEKKSGQIVVVSGALAKLYLPGRTAYCGAKAALHGYFGSLRNEVAKHNIDITLLVPGAMNTALVQSALTGKGEITGESVPPTTEGCPVDIAANQAVTAIKNRCFETYIGKKDKTALMLHLARLFPNFITRKLYTQFKGS